jgi:hypothetical protein
MALSVLPSAENHGIVNMARVIVQRRSISSI